MISIIGLILKAVILSLRKDSLNRYLLFVAIKKGKLPLSRNRYIRFEC